MYACGSIFGARLPGRKGGDIKFIRIYRCAVVLTSNQSIVVEDDDGQHHFIIIQICWWWRWQRQQQWQQQQQPQRTLNNCVIRCTFCSWKHLHRRHHFYCENVHVCYVMYTCVCIVCKLHVYDNVCMCVCMRWKTIMKYVIKCRHWKWMRENVWIHFLRDEKKVKGKAYKNSLYTKIQLFLVMNWIFHEFSINMICYVCVYVCVFIYNECWPTILTIDDLDIHAVYLNNLISPPTGILLKHECTTLPILTYQVLHVSNKRRTLCTTTNWLYTIQSHWHTRAYIVVYNTTYIYISLDLALSKMMQWILNWKFENQHRLLWSV